MKKTQIKARVDKVAINLKSKFSGIISYHSFSNMHVEWIFQFLVCVCLKAF